MDGNSWRAAQGDPNMDPNDWRTQLTLDSRQKIVNKILETLKRHLPVSGLEGIVELKKIAVRFEEKVYTAAISQLLEMETKSQSDVVPNSLPSDSAAGNQNQPDPASHNIQLQVRNAEQSLPTSMPNQSQYRQQHITQSLQNSISSSGMQSSNLPPALSSITGLTQTSISNGIGQSSGLQNMGPISQNAVNNSLGQGVASNMFANFQRPMQARQQVSPQQHQLQNPQNQFVYLQQLQHQLLKQKLQQSSLISQSHLQQQQQQQPLLQPNQMQQTSQQSLMSQNSGLQSSQTTLQQAQPSVMPPAQQFGLQQNQQALQSTAHQQPSVLQHQIQIGQQQIMTSQQQQQLIGQHGNATNMQQNHLLGQHNGIPDIQQQQQQQQQQRLLGQQQQQLGQQNNISSQQLLGQQPGISNIQQHQNQIQQLLQAKAATQQAPSMLLLPQGQQSQPQPSQQQQLMSQLQSQPVQLQQQIALQQQQQSNQLSWDLQQRLQASGGLLQPQNVMDQQKQMFQAQRGHPKASSTSMDSTAQTGHSTPVDWQEETYQKMKSLKDMYFPEIYELTQKLALKCQQQDNLGQAQMAPMQSDQLEKLKYYKNYLERIIQYLQAPKNNISLNTKERIGGVEKQIVAILTMFKRKPNSSQQQQQQGQQQFPPPGGQTLSMQQQQLQNQISQMQQQHDNHPKQMQQGSVTSAMTMQHGSMPLSSRIGVQTTQPVMMTGSNSEPTQGSGLSSLQQGAMDSLQQNTFNLPQQSNMNMLSQNLLQSNIGPLQQQHMKEQHEQQQLLQTQQIKQQFQQRQTQQLMQLQQFQQHLLRQQQSAQLQAHQMQQLQQINEANEMKVKPGTVLKSELFQHPVNQRPAYHQQLIPGTTFPVSSPQLLQTTSQISQHSSPQIDQQSLLTASIPKTGTPLLPANSPFIVPSPSTPLAPSPIPGDPEKQTSGLLSLSSAGNIGHQQPPVALTQAQSLAIGTPGISASPLLEQCTGQDGNQGTGSTLFSGNKSNAAERPLDRLIEVASPTIRMLVRAHTIHHQQLEIENKSLRDKLRCLKTVIIFFVFLYFLWFFI